MSPHALRIAILTHSTNPRGGVVHALELGDALTRLGHEVVVHAPDSGKGFFRQALCQTVGIPAGAAETDLAAMVEARVADYLNYFEQAGRRRFDVWHAQDGISANALATMKARGVISAFARTVHHIDTSQAARVTRLQKRGISAADELFVVSRLWEQALRRDFDRTAVVVGNGVDTQRFSPRADATDAVLRSRPQYQGGPVFLAVGGVEARKNTIEILAAFGSVQRGWPQARLLIAGGASLLDHAAYQQQFEGALRRSGLPADAVVRIGTLPQAEMPALYRLADALVFPSIKEGFGLVVLEAMASGVPVVVSRIAPFIDYLEEDDACWCDPGNPASIAAAMRTALDADVRPRLIANGFAVAARCGWESVAKAHLPIYAGMLEHCHA